MPDVIVTANNLIGKVGDNFADLLKLGSSAGEGFKTQVVTLPAECPEESFNADDLTEEAFSCIRALSQVQDLVTDKSWFGGREKMKTTKAANNQQLTNLIGNQPYTHSCDLLIDQELKSAFVNQFSPFVTGDLQELGKRFLQIQQLNTQLVLYFSKLKGSRLSQN